MDNADIARLLDEVGDLLEILGENVFRIRAYRTAARTVEALAEPVTKLLARDPEALCELPGIAKDLAGKIGEIASTGDLALRRELAAKVPASLTTMMRVAGIGPKRAKLFYDELGIRTLDELEAAARSGELRGVHGVGEVLEKRILQGCAEQRARAGRFKLSEADAHAAPLLEHLRACPAAERVEIAGSLRRRRESVGDIDLLVASRDPSAIAERFVRYPDLTKLLARGDTKCSGVLQCGMQVDVRIVEPECWGAALHYFTGSKAHNIAVRTLGVKRKLKMSEYGVFRGKRRVGGRTEEEVFAAVGLPWIPPELREDRGEIRAAREGALPRLVELSDIRGDLHVHTDASDGKSSLREMVEACAARGYAYVAVTDHTKALRVAGGLDRAAFARQRRAVEALRRELPQIAILHGAEVDVLEDGRLDLDDETLSEFDIVVAAVHEKLAMPEATMTARVLRALANPFVDVLAHPTGRLIGEREPSALDFRAVVVAAKEHGVFLEVDAHPDRLDLCDTLARMARDAGVPLVIDSDAHRVGELDNMRYGVDQARRGWATAADVANALPLEALRAALRRARRCSPADLAPPSPRRTGRGPRSRAARSHGEARCSGGSRPRPPPASR
jgi:DNA polymerase (family 10)